MIWFLRRLVITVHLHIPNQLCNVFVVDLVCISKYDKYSFRKSCRKLKLVKVFVLWRYWQTWWPFKEALLQKSKTVILSTAFKRWDEVKDENIWYCRGSLKKQISRGGRGVTKNLYIRGGRFSKKGAWIVYNRLGNKRWGVVF